MISPEINTQRRDRQLTYDTVVGDGSNPIYTFLAAAGSLRGIIVNVLWMRAEKLKTEGRHFEAMKLAELITTLQPRFPAVWEYMSWNMAYNISVECNTQEERWDWINKGMRLLREQGIPNNPRATKLYRQLSWILFHKMGGQTDDMHWYYKRQFADEWETLLGAPDRMRAPKPEIADVPQERWHEMLPDQFEYASIFQFRMIDEKAQAYFLIENPHADEFGEQNYTGVLTQDARDQFFEDYPGLEDVITEIQQLRSETGEELGLGLNDKTLRALGRIMMLEFNGYVLTTPIIRNREVLGAEGLALMAWLQARGQDPETLPIALTGVMQLGPYDPQLVDRNGDVAAISFRPVLDLLRAQALIADYHMDPGFMMKLMDDFGPIDWRNVHAHALYWAALGSRKADEVLDHTRVDIINLDRQRLHSLQGLAHFGTLAFRPRVEQLGQLGAGLIFTMPDPRLTEAYGIALEETRARLDEWDAKDDTYLTGRENFLQSAVVNCFYGGQTGLARHYFEVVKEEFGYEGSDSLYVGEYRLSLDEFAYIRLVDDDLKENRRAYLRGLLMRAWGLGLMQHDLEITRRLYRAARTYHEKETERAEASGADPNIDTQGRQALPPFEDMVIETFSMVVADAGYNLQDRISMWQMSSQFLPHQIRIMVYYSIRGPLKAQFEAQQLPYTVEQVFAKPEGFDEWADQYDQYLQENNRP